MKIGITGATGQLGKWVVAKLKERTSAENLVALVRSPEKAIELGIEARQFDYSASEGLANSLQGIDHLLLISSSEVGQRASQHRNVIEAAKQAGVKWIVYTSLLKADSTSLSLGPEHAETEGLLEASGIPFTILRNGWYTENHWASLAAVRESGVWIGSAGDGRFSAATREDFAEAAAVVLTTEGHQGNTYELAGDESFTMAELAAEVSRQTGQEISYSDLPQAKYESALIGSGLPEFLAKLFAGFDESARQGDLFDDSKQLSHLIGRPTTSLSAAVSAALV
jgi:NAD(P)H dehydrogenase (quinone)